MYIGVEVGTLLAIDLDRHEVGVEVGGRRLVLERLPLHDVTPMAGGIADGEEDRASRRVARAVHLRPKAYQSTGLWAC